jgi:endonuclease G
MRAFIRYFVAIAAILLLNPSSVLAQTRDGNRALGNPSGATASLSNPNNYLIDKSMYSLSWNKSRNQPNWVSWHLSKAWYGSAPRSSTFTASPNLLGTGWPRIFQDTFTNSKFDRGHMCPSADRDFTSDENKITFHGDNIVLQSPNNNQGPWAKLEAYCRNLADAGNEMYIVCGPWGSGGKGSDGVLKYDWVGPAKDGGTMTVKVPTWTWKVVLVLPNGSNDASRVTSSTRLIAVKMPNDDTVMTQSTGWGGYRVKARDIETMTGYNFFSALPQSVQDAIETKVDTGPTN